MQYHDIAEISFVIKLGVRQMRWSYSRSEALDGLYCREGSAKKDKLVDKVAEA